MLEKNLKEFRKLKGLAVSYDTPVGFNVSTATVSQETVMLTYTNPDFQSVAADGTLFTSYIFANEEIRYLGEISLTFTTDLYVQDIVVPEIVPLLRNQHIKVSGNMMAESPDENNEYEISFDIDVEDWTSRDQEV